MRPRNLAVIVVTMTAAGAQFVGQGLAQGEPQQIPQVRDGEQQGEGTEAQRARQARKWARRGYRGCRTSACAVRVKRARIKRAGFEGCHTWACAARVKRKRLARMQSRLTPPGVAWLRSTRMCESGGNYSTNTGNGFFGGYQFMLSTWHSVGGRGYPHQASPAEQDLRAAILYRRSGPGQWPQCGR